MKKKISKLSLKKTVVTIHNPKALHKMHGGEQATAPIFSCKIYCGPTWMCPPPDTSLCKGF